MPTTPPDTPTPGEELRGIRQHLGLSVTAFAKLLGCHRVTVHHYEQGTRVPGLPVLTLARWYVALYQARPPEEADLPPPPGGKRPRPVVPPPPLLYVPPDKHTPVFVLYGLPLPGQGCAWAPEGECDGECWRLVLLLEPGRDPADMTVCQAHFWQAYVRLQEEVHKHWKRLKGKQRRKEQRLWKQQREGKPHEE